MSIFQFKNGQETVFFVGKSADENWLCHFQQETEELQMCSKFCKSMVQTFISAACGSVLSQAAMRGIAGAQTPIDWVDSAINGLKTGTAFIAYPVAVRVLSDACPTYKKHVECPKASKIPVYVFGGALGALICTAVNVPLNKVQQKRKGACKKGECGCSLVNCAKCFAGAYVDQIGSSIGFAATNGTLGPLVPTTTNSFLAWARNNALVNISNIGGKILSYPIHRIRHGSTLTGMITDYVKGMGGVVITGDACAFFKGVFACIAE